MADNEALATIQTGALAPARSYIDADDRRGLEHITREDITIPRLALAQALSPQVTEGDPRRIEGCKAGDLFNSQTGQIYGGRIPVVVQIIRKDKQRAMQFRSIEDGGSVLDPNVPLNDPRLQWGENGEKPEATLFMDFLALVHPTRELIALSFKSSGLAAAKNLNKLILFRKKAIFAGLYSIKTGIKQQPKLHQIYIVDNAGWVSEEDYRYGEEMFEAVKDLDVVSGIDRDGSATPDSDPDVPF